jgi:hypothetical protein
MSCCIDFADCFHQPDVFRPFSAGSSNSLFQAGCWVQEHNTALSRLV